MVWFPTVDGINQRTSRAQAPAGSTPPMWAALQQELRDEGVDPPPVAVVGEDGKANQATLDVLRVIAKYDMALRQDTSRLPRSAPWSLPRPRPACAGSS